MRKVQSRSARARRTILVATVVTGMMLASHAAFAQAPAGQPAPSTPAQPAPAQPAPAQPGQQPAQAASGITFEGDAALWFMQIKPDKTADFESVLAKLKEALAKTDKPERKQQAAGWRVYRSTDPGPGGSVMYVAVITSPLKGADYTEVKILAEVFPSEVQAIWPAFRDALAAGRNRMNLNLVQDFSTAGQAQSAPSAPPPAQQQQQ